MGWGWRGPGRGCRCCRGEAVITPISQMWPAGPHGSPTLGWAGAQRREPAQALRCPSIRASSPSRLAGELPAPHTRPSGWELQALLPARAGPLLPQPGHLIALGHLHRRTGSGVDTWECVHVRV